MSLTYQATLTVAVEVAAEHGIHYILDDFCRLVSPKMGADKFAFDPGLLPRELGAVAAAAARYAERQFAEVTNVKRGANIDFP